MLLIGDEPSTPCSSRRLSPPPASASTPRSPSSPPPKLSAAAAAATTGGARATRTKGKEGDEDGGQQQQQQSLPQRPAGHHRVTSGPWPPSCAESSARWRPFSRPFPRPRPHLACRRRCFLVPPPGRHRASESGAAALERHLHRHRKLRAALLVDSPHGPGSYRVFSSAAQSRRARRALLGALRTRRPPFNGTGTSHRRGWRLLPGRCCPRSGGGSSAGGSSSSSSGGGGGGGGGGSVVVGGALSSGGGAGSTSAVPALAMA